MTISSLVQNSVSHSPLVFLSLLLGTARPNLLLHTQRFLPAGRGNLQQHQGLIWPQTHLRFFMSPFDTHTADSLFQSWPWSSQQKPFARRFFLVSTGVTQLQKSGGARGRRVPPQCEVRCVCRGCLGLGPAPHNTFETQAQMGKRNTPLALSSDVNEKSANFLSYSVFLFSSCVFSYAYNFMPKETYSAKISSCILA